MPQINADLLPMKGHFFFFNAGTAPLVPYLATYAKQLGLSSSITGIIYTILPILGLLAKPIFGAIGDRFHKHKFIFIAFQVVTIAGFMGLYFIPSTYKSTTELSCGDGAAFFHTCFTNTSTIGECESISIMSENSETTCKMKCAIDKPLMWETICGYWKIPQFCYARNDDFDFTGIIPKQSLIIENECITLPVHKATHGDLTLQLIIGLPERLSTEEVMPKCLHANAIETKCSVNCYDKRVDPVLSHSSQNFNVDMVCNQNTTYFKSCNRSNIDILNNLVSIKGEAGNLECKAVCRLVTPQQRAILCSNWKTFNGPHCTPNTSSMPASLSFTGVVPLNKTLQEGQCLYFKLWELILDDGSIHKPYCPRLPANSQHFKTSCEVHCNNHKVNNVIMSTVKEKNDTGNHLDKILMFFIFMSINWIGMAVVVSIADAICFEKLGDKPEDYGRQRLWGSIGWGLFSPISGLLIDKFSEGKAEKDYSIAFILMIICLGLDILMSAKLHYKQKRLTINIFGSVGVLFSSWRAIHFFVWIVVVGVLTGLQWQFLFWYLEDLVKGDCDQMSWTKTLQGLVGGLQSFGGEIPFFFLSGKILNKIGHINSMTLVLLGFGVRFMLYSTLVNPWLVLPIELFQGLTFGMLYSTMTSYASITAPPGIEATVMGLVGAVFEGVGVSLGSFTGGIIYDYFGGSTTFRIYGCIALLFCFINILLIFFKVFKNPEPEAAAYTSISYHGNSNDTVDFGNLHNQNENT